MVFLQGHNVSEALAVKIYNMYQDDSIHKVTADPYRLARDISGIGFKTADQIARNMGLPQDSPERIAAGITFALQTPNDEGHVYAPRDVTIEKAAETSKVPADQCETAVGGLFPHEP